MTAFRPPHGVAELVFVAKELVRVAGVERVEVPRYRDVPLRLVVVVVVAPERRDGSIGKCRNVVTVGPVETEKELIGKVSADHLCVGDACTPVQPSAADRYLEIVGWIQERRGLCIRIPIAPC